MKISVVIPVYSEKTTIRETGKPTRYSAPNATSRCGSWLSSTTEQ